MVKHEAEHTTFKELERQGWGAKADNYNALAGQITIGAVAPLLDATGVCAGTRILESPQGRVMSPPAPRRVAHTRSE